MSEKSEKRRRRLTVCAVLMYAVFLAAAVLAYTSIDDEDSRLMALYFISSTLTLATLIFALLVMRSSPSERYYEKYLEKDDDGSEK